MTLDEITDQADREAVVARCLATLTDRDRRVVEARFGFDGEPMKFREIGAAIGVTGNRAKQIYDRAIRRMKHPSVSRAARDFWT